MGDQSFRTGLLRAATLASVLLPPVSSMAQAASPAAPPSPETVVAKVQGHDIHMSDIQEAAQSLPPELRGVPVQILYPMLLNQAVDREALTLAARKRGLEKDPKVQHAMQRADNEVLQNALLAREVGPTVTEDAIRARYDRDYKDKPGQPEVHARHILVSSEDAAKKIIAQLKAGASFEQLAKKNSTDPGAANGGDLGWFKRSDMVPAFADAAFALKPGEVTPTPVHTQFGWHVIKLEGTRTAPPQTFEQLHDQIRQALIQEGVKKAVADARQGLQVEEFAPDGSKLPPPAAPAASASAGTKAGTATAPDKH